jgi:hypothetical protein
MKEISDDAQPIRKRREEKMLFSWRKVEDLPVL